MSEYMLQPSILPFPPCNEAKDKRRKVLAGVRERRKIIYTRYMKKIQRHSPIEFAV